MKSRKLAAFRPHLRSSAKRLHAAEGGHQHEVAAGDADIGRERGALGADAFLDDLHDDFVAPAKDLLDGRLDSRASGTAIAALAALRSFAAFGLPIVVRHDFGGIVAALTEVLRLDVADMQEAVAADAEVDERRLDARLQVDDLALIDVAYVVVLAGCARYRALLERHPR